MLCLLLIGTRSFAQQPALIPQPAQVEWVSGTFILPYNATISCENARLRPAAGYLSDLLRRSTGHRVAVKKSHGTIQLALTPQGKEGSYTLQVTRKGIRITASAYAGIINGIATLRQLLPEKIESERVVEGFEWTVPCVRITDEPRFGWRGMHLDCSRHFFTKAEVMALLDVLALYKIDKFHWHLTDDQGWRIEIKKYPLLTGNGAWRSFNGQDSVCITRAKAEDNPMMQIQPSNIRTDAQGRQQYGGFYTQQDIREVVDYAAVRGIEIIPEIDMPGHSLCAIGNYDGLSCFPQTGWGRVFSTPMCPGKDRMLAFCKDVWREVFDLFPSKYVHLGGDEVDMKNWTQCPDCQKRMREHGLKTTPELQTWFNHYMESFFNANGKEMIGWDEIIEGGLSATSTVMWWRSWQPDAPKETTTHGNRLISCPNANFYLDYDEDAHSLDKILAFNPLPDKLTAAEKTLVMGVQGNLWTEWVPSAQMMWWRAFPRMLAVAELGWHGPADASSPDFTQRLAAHFPRLQQLGVNYRIPDLTGFHATNVFTSQGRVDLACADTSAIIRYTTDGTFPQATSPRYTGPMTLDQTTRFIFRTFRKDGTKGEMVKAAWIKEDFAPAVVAEKGSEGLLAKWYDYAGAHCAGIDQATHMGDYVVPGVVIPEACKDNIGLVITGFIEVPADDLYTFALLSDDGSYLKLDGQMVIDNDGEHSPREIYGQHAMRRGLHPLHVRYFDHNGGQLRLRVLGPDGQEIKVRYFAGKQ